MSIRQMMKSIRMLENSPSVYDKMELIRVALEINPDFKDVLFFALNPYLKFNTQRVVYKQWPLGQETDNWSVIKGSLETILKSQFRGLMLEDQMACTASKLSSDGRELFKRILLKDLRCGVGATLVNRVVPGLIPQFGVMLADPITEAIVKKLNTASFVWWQPKLNGDRMVVMIPPTNQRKTYPSRGLTRNGHELLNYGAIIRSLEFVVDQIYPREGMVFDGEVIVGDFFETRQTKKLAGNEVAHAKYAVFDMIGFTQWANNNSFGYRERCVSLQALGNTDAWQIRDNLTRVKSFPLKPGSITMALLDDLRDEAVKQGYEGLIVRPDMFYNYSTRSSLFKHKKMDNADCMILEILEGEEGKKHSGRAGKMMVEQEDGTPCKAGLSLTDAERVEMWDNRNDYVGKIAEIQYQEMTKPKKGAPKMQFPVFIRVRKDKS